MDLPWPAVQGLAACLLVFGCRIYPRREALWRVYGITLAFGGKFPYLVAGDRMAMEIDGLGRQEQTLIPWEAQA